MSSRKQISTAKIEQTTPKKESNCNNAGPSFVGEKQPMHHFNLNDMLKWSLKKPRNNKYPARPYRFNHPIVNNPDEFSSLDVIAEVAASPLVQTFFSIDYDYYKLPAEAANNNILEDSEDEQNKTMVWKRTEIRTSNSKNKLTIDDQIQKGEKNHAAVSSKKKRSSAKKANDHEMSTSSNKAMVVTNKSGYSSKKPSIAFKTRVNKNDYVPRNLIDTDKSGDSSRNPSKSSNKNLVSKKDTVPKDLNVTDKKKKGKEHIEEVWMEVETNEHSIAQEEGKFVMNLRPRKQNVLRRSRSKRSASARAACSGCPGSSTGLALSKEEKGGEAQGSNSENPLEGYKAKMANAGTTKARTPRVEVGASMRQTGKAKLEEAFKRPPKFSLTLTFPEIVRDFIAMTGKLPPRKINKRPDAVQRRLDMLTVGHFLESVKPQDYMVDHRRRY
ncbi:hypothetical protein ACFE04_026743 [Oxalis oulophora]